MRVIKLPDAWNVLNSMVLAAKRCYSNLNGKDLCTKVALMDQKEKSEFLLGLVKKGHLSVLEHAHFSFHIEGISRACSHQLVRHRHFSFNQMSHRYTKSPKFVPVPHFTPEQQAFKDEHDSEALGKYYKLLEEGVAPEDARFLLPESLETRLLMTGSVRSFFEFLPKRLCTRAQWEIRELATRILTTISRTNPELPFFNVVYVGPKCLTSSCNEYCGVRVGNLIIDEVSDYMSKMDGNISGDVDEDS